MRVLVAFLLLSTVFAGCAVQDDPTLRLAFVPTDDDVNDEKDPQRLANFIATHSGRDTEIVWVDNTQAAFEAMRAGQADAAFVDGAAGWFGWKRFGFEAIAADQNSDGRTHYIAAAWVLDNSTYTSMQDLEGAVSCHTGLLKSAGMFMPLGWMIGNDLVDVQGPADDIASIEPTVRAYFPDAIIPGSGAPYSGYNGALQCLSEGVGAVAFVKDTTPESYCGDDAKDWCLSLDQYRMIQEFGQVPSHPVMVRELGAKADDLTRALLALNDDAEGQAILDEVLETPGITQVTSESHLGDYGANLQHVPGIQTYVDSKLQ